jgi:hypothetical protein
MKKLYQTRFEDKGNCYAAVIASVMDRNSAEDVIQIQEHYDNPKWIGILVKWIVSNGWVSYPIHGHDSADKDEFYLVSGESPRHLGTNHICIYQNGKLYHDPHLDNTGIITEEYFEIIERL